MKTNKNNKIKFKKVLLILIPRWLRKLIFTTDTINYSDFKKEIQIRTNNPRSNRIRYSVIIFVFVVSCRYSYNYGKLNQTIYIREAKLLLDQKTLECQKLIQDLEKNQSAINLSLAKLKLEQQKINEPIELELIKAQTSLTNMQTEYLTNQNVVTKLQISEKIGQTFMKVAKIFSGIVFIRYGVPFLWKIFLTTQTQSEHIKPEQQSLKPAESVRFYPTRTRSRSYAQIKPEASQRPRSYARIKPKASQLKERQARIQELKIEISESTKKLEEAKIRSSNTAKINFKHWLQTKLEIAQLKAENRKLTSNLVNLTETLNNTTVNQNKINTTKRFQNEPDNNFDEFRPHKVEEKKPQLYKKKSSLQFWNSVSAYPKSVALNINDVQTYYTPSELVNMGYEINEKGSVLPKKNQLFFRKSPFIAVKQEELKQAKLLRDKERSIQNELRIIDKNKKL